MAQNSKGAYLNVLQDADGKDVYPITRADGVYMNDGTTAQAKCEALDSKIDSAKSSFQAGVDGIYNAITAQGTTPASKSQGDVKNAIGTLATNKYNQGKNDVSLSVSGSYVTASNGKSARVDYKGKFYRNEGNNVGLAGDYFHATFPEGYYGSEGQAWAPEIRVPVGTMNSNGWYDQDQYNAHYNQGVTDADNRANSNSTNYKSGYSSGYNAGYSAGKSSVKTGSFIVNSSNTYDGVWCRRIDNYNVGHTVLMAGITARPKPSNYVIIGTNASWGIQVTWSGSKISVIIPYGQAGRPVDDFGPFGDWTITYAYYA